MHESEENWFQAIYKVVFPQKRKYIAGWKWKFENDDKSKKSSRSSKKSSGRNSERSSHSSRWSSSENSFGRISAEVIALWCGIKK